MTDKSTEQVSKSVTPPQLRNPTGKGGFGDNPDNRNPGGWDKTKSISYQYNRFLRMTPSELKEYANTPDDQRTVAQDLAYKRVIAAQKSLPDMKEITDRTEGKAAQSMDLTTGGDKINSLNNLSDDELNARIRQHIEARAN